MRFKGTFFLLLVATLLVTLLFGSESLDLPSLLDSTSKSYRLLFELRLPRLLLVICVGGSLAVLGGTYQILFRNPLAEPYVLGISSAVALGIVVAEVFFGTPWGSLGASFSGFLLALLVALILVGLCFSRAGTEVDRIILFGMGMSFLFSSLLFLILSYHHQHMGGGSMRWLFGQVPWLGIKEALWIGLATLPFLALLLIFSRHLDGLSLGDGVARTLGFSPTQTRAWVLLLSSLFLAILVSVTGAIGFVGLVVPHAVRLVFRPSTTRILFCLSFLLGAVFLACSDLASRLLFPPFEFPIGIITTLIGGPVFLYLLWKR